MTIDLAKEARDKGIEYFLISFVDLFVLRSPVRRLMTRLVFVVLAVSGSV